MAEAKAPDVPPTLTPEGGNARHSGNAAPPPDQTLGLRLAPVNNSDQPVVANTSNVQVAPGMAYIDFGFVEPGLLAALPRVAKQGGAMPKEINGKLAVRVVMGYDGLAQLQQQLTRVMRELAKAAKRHNGGNT